MEIIIYGKNEIEGNSDLTIKGDQLNIKNSKNTKGILNKFDLLEITQDSSMNFDLDNLNWTNEYTLISITSYAFGSQMSERKKNYNK